MIPYIKLSDVDFHYHPEESIFSRLSLDISPGKINVLTGPNGIGKSTLIKLISGELKPCKGSINVCGETEEKERLKHCRVVTQGLAPFPALKLKEYIELLLLDNLSFLGSRLNLHKRFRSIFSSETLNEINSNYHKRCRYIDLPIIQKIELSIAIATRSNVLLLDEPFANLEDNKIKIFCSYLEKMAIEEMVVILVTHKLDYLNTNSINKLSIPWNHRPSHLSNTRSNIRSIHKTGYSLSSSPIIDSIDQGAINVLLFKDLYQRSIFINNTRYSGFMAKQLICGGKNILHNYMVEDITVLGVDRYKFDVIRKLSIKNNFEILLNLDKRLLSRRYHDDMGLRKSLEALQVKYKSLNQICLQLSIGNIHKLIFTLLPFRNTQYIYIEEPLAGICLDHYQLIIDYLKNIPGKKIILIGLCSMVDYNFINTRE
jgi:ABC-type sugar transport system ATPase subunit